MHAYRQALAVNPGLGEAWWSLANLKTVRFDEADIAAMKAGLEVAGSNDDQLHLHFALGKALEDAKRWAGSFAHYDQGNRLRRKELPYDADETHAESGRHAEVFTAPFLASRGRRMPGPRTRSSSSACRAPAPPWSSRSSPATARSKARMELPDLMMIASRLRSARGRAAQIPYADTLARPVRRRSPARWAKSTWSAPASIGARTGRCSSTRCRTIGSTSA